MNEKIMKKVGFEKEVEAVREGKCSICGKTINLADFRNELSKREYTISGLCQKCQDDIFGKD